LQKALFQMLEWARVRGFITAVLGMVIIQLWLLHGLVIFIFVNCSITLILGVLRYVICLGTFSWAWKQAEAIQQSAAFQGWLMSQRPGNWNRVLFDETVLVEKLKKDLPLKCETAQWLQAKAFKDSCQWIRHRHFFEIRWNSHFSERERGIDGLALLVLTDWPNLINERGYESADMFISVCLLIISQKNIVYILCILPGRFFWSWFCFINSKFDPLQLKQVVEDFM